MKKIILLTVFMLILSWLPYKTNAEENPKVLSVAAIVMDAKTGMVLYEKNS